jgi:type II secretory pathway component PulF
MPKFNYVAMDSRGKETKGTLEVANQNEAIGRIKEMGFLPHQGGRGQGRAPPGRPRKPAGQGQKRAAAAASISRSKSPA